MECTEMCYYYYFYKISPWAKVDVYTLTPLKKRNRLNTVPVCM